METFTFVYRADAVLVRPVHVGVVASGDLEIVITPSLEPAQAVVALRTSVDGFEPIWRRVLDRFFERGAFRGRYEINDFGATPGMVSLRLAQARELATDGPENGVTE
jgi:malonate decarboxylase acyl carrier protein